MWTTGPPGLSGRVHGQPEAPPPSYEQAVLEDGPHGSYRYSHGQPEVPPPAYEQHAPQCGQPRPGYVHTEQCGQPQPRWQGDRWGITNHNTVYFF